jgi:hypothetical protein
LWNAVAVFSRGVVAKGVVNDWKTGFLSGAIPLWDTMTVHRSRVVAKGVRNYWKSSVFGLGAENSGDILTDGFGGFSNCFALKTTKEVKSTADSGESEREVASGSIASERREFFH